MGGAIIFIALFAQNYTPGQQHNMSQSCDPVSYIKKYARLDEKDQKETQNNMTTPNFVIQHPPTHKIGHHPKPNGPGPFKSIFTLIVGSSQCNKAAHGCWEVVAIKTCLKGM